VPPCSYPLTVLRIRDTFGISISDLHARMAIELT
jgi:hypothetical protein